MAGGGRALSLITYLPVLSPAHREELGAALSGLKPVSDQVGVIMGLNSFKRACRPFSKQVENCVPKLDWDNHFFISDGHLISDLF